MSRKRKKHFIYIKPEDIVNFHQMLVERHVVSKMSILNHMEGQSQ